MTCEELIDSRAQFGGRRRGGGQSSWHQLGDGCVRAWTSDGAGSITTGVWLLWR